MTNVPVKRGEAARQQPQVAVTDADREAAAAALDKLEIAGCYYAREVEKLAQAIARARAEGADAMRERCALWLIENDYAGLAAAIRARSEGGKA